MFRKDDFIDLIKAHVLEADETAHNKRRAYESAGKQLGRLLESGKVKLNYVPIRTIVEACLEESDFDDIGSLKEMSATEISEAVTSSAFPNITKYIVNSAVIPAYEYRANELSPLYTEITATRTDVERLAGFTANEGVRRVPEHAPVTSTDLKEKYVDCYLDKYQRSIELTKEAIFNDNTGQLIQRASDLGNKLGDQIEEYLIQTIEVRPRSLRGVETTSNLQAAVFEGNIVTNSNFYSTDHSSLSYMHNQVNANKATKTLDTDGLDSVIVMFSNMVDERGEKVVVRPKTLLVHTNKARIAWQILNSMGQYDTANNAANPFRKDGWMNFNVIDTPYINTNTHWYLGDFKKQIVLAYWERPNIVTLGKGSERAFTNDVIMSWKLSVGFGACHRDYIYIIYSAASS